MPFLSSSSFVSQVLGGKLGMAPVYLLFGQETQRLNESAAKIKEMTLPLAGGEENYFRYVRLGDGADETSATEVAAQLNTVSMFGGGKIVWVGTLESLPKDEAEALTAYAQNPNPQCALIVTISLNGWEKKAVDAFESSKLVTAFSEKGVAVKFAPPRTEELVKWVQSRFNERSCRIDTDAAQRLVELADKDMDRLAGEVEKIALYAGPGSGVTLDMVEESTGDYRTESIWDFLKLFRRKDLPGSIRALDSLMSQNVATQVTIKTLTGEIMKIGAALEYKKRRESMESYASALGQPSFKVKDLWVDADRWSPRQVKNALRAVLNATMSQMQAGVDPAVAMNAMVLAALSGNAAKKPGK